MEGEETERFRTSLILRIAVVSALILWISAAIVMFVFAAFSIEPIRLSTLITVLLFVLFFGLASLHYARRAFITSPDGLTITGAFSFRSFAWREIISVERSPGLLPGYVVFTKRGNASFFCLEIPDHQRLLHTIERMRHVPHAKGGESPPPERTTDPKLAEQQRRSRRRRRRHDF